MELPILLFIHPPPRQPRAAYGSRDQILFNDSELTRHLADHTIAEILGRLPNIESADWTIFDGCAQYISLRRGLRGEFAKALQLQLPRCSCLKSLGLLLSGHTLWAPDAANGSLSDDGSEIATGDQSLDTLSTAICMATTQLPNLESLMIRGVVGASLFPPGHGQVPVPSVRQKLQHLQIYFLNRTPTGGHHFAHSSLEILPMPSEGGLPPGYRTGDDAEDPVLSVAQFTLKGYNGLYMPFLGLHKAVPNDDALEELFRAFASTCRGLPVLKVASLHTTTPVPVDRHKEPYHCGRERWGVWYLGAGVDASEILLEDVDERLFECVAQPRVYWETRGWPPGYGLEGLMASVGVDRGEQPVVFHASSAP